MKIQRIRQWVVGAGLFVAIPFLYTEYRFKTDPLSFVLHPVFRQTTPFQEDHEDYLSHETLSIIRSGEQIAAAATEDADFFFDTLRLWDVQTLSSERTLSDPTITGVNNFTPVINPQGTMLAIAGSVQVAQVLDAETGEAFSALASNDTVNDVALSPDGAHAVAAQWNDANQQWQVDFVNVQTGAVDRSVVPELERDLDEIYHVALSLDGKMLAIALPQSVQIWRIDAPDRSTLLHTIASKPRTYTTAAINPKAEPLMFSADSTRLTIHENVARIKQIDTNTGATLHEKKDFCFDDGLAISPSGTQYACMQGWNEALTIAVGSIENEEPPITIEGFALSDYNAFSADGKSLLVEKSIGDYYLHNIKTGKSVPLEYDAEDSGIKLAAFNRDRTAIITHVYAYSETIDGQRYYTTPIRILDPNTLELIQTTPFSINNHSYALQLSYQTIATQTEERVLNLWRITPTGIEQLRSFRSAIADSPRAAAFSPDGETLAVLHSDDGKKVAVMNAASGEISHTLNLEDADYRDILFSADGAQIITTHTNTIGSAGSSQFTHHMVMRDAETGEIIRQFNLFASPDNASSEGTSKGSTQPYLAAFALSDDGKLLITRTEEAAYLWNAETGEYIRTLAESNPASSEKETAALDVAISKDNQWAALAGYDGKLYIWDLETGEPIRALPLKSLPFEKRGGGARNLAFSADRKKLFATSGSQIVQWQLPAQFSLW